MRSCASRTSLPAPTLATEVFSLGTRMTRLSRALRIRDPELALAAAGRAVPDWAGGTTARRDAARIPRPLGPTRPGPWRRRGDLLGRLGARRPILLAEQMAALRRLAHAVLWVNPHAGADGYQPVQSGIAAALPFTDRLLAGHSLATLQELLDEIAARDTPAVIAAEPVSPFSSVPPVRQPEQSEAYAHHCHRRRNDLYRTTWSRGCSSCTTCVTGSARSAPWSAATPATAARAPFTSNGHSVKSCSVLAVQADGGDVDHRRGPVSRRRDAAPDPGSVPRQPRAAVRLLHARHDHADHRPARREPRPDEEAVRLGLEGNLCRCTGYQNIVSAVQDAAQRLRGAATAETVMRERCSEGRYGRRCAMTATAEPRNRQGQAAQGRRASDHRPHPVDRQHRAARACSTWPSCAAPSRMRRITGIDTTAARRHARRRRGLHRRRPRRRARQPRHARGRSPRT